MIDNTTNVEEVVGETVVPETTPQTVEKEPQEKKLTQGQVDSIVAKIRSEESAKAEASTKELQERLEKLEEERKAEKAEAELKEKIFKEAEVQSKESHLASIIDSKVKDAYKDNVKDLVKIKLNLETSTLEEIDAKIDEVINSLPGVTKGTGNASTPLNQIENVVKESQSVEPTTQEFGFYTESGTKLNITKEEYDKLPEFKKERIIVK